MSSIRKIIGKVLRGKKQEFSVSILLSQVISKTGFQKIQNTFLISTHNQQVYILFALLQIFLNYFL